MKKLKTKQRTSEIGRRTGVNVVSGRKIREQEDGTDVFDDYWTDSDSENSTISVASHASEGGKSIGFLSGKSLAVARSFTKSPKKKSLERSPTRKRKGEKFHDRSCNTSNTEIFSGKDVSKVRRAELSANKTRATKDAIATDDDAANKSLSGVQKSPVKSVQKKRSEHFEDGSSDSSLERSSTRNKENEEFDERSNISCPDTSFGSNMSEGKKTELSENRNRATRNVVAPDGDTSDEDEVQKSPVKRDQKKIVEYCEDGRSDSSLERSSTRNRQDEEFDERSNNSSPGKPFSANISLDRKAKLFENGIEATGNAVASDRDTPDKNVSGVRKSPVKRVQRKSVTFRDVSTNSRTESSPTRKKNDEEVEDHGSSPEKPSRADVSKVTGAELSKSKTRENKNAIVSDGDTPDKNVSRVRKSPVERVQKRRSRNSEDISNNSRAESSLTSQRKDKEIEDHANNSVSENSFRPNVSKVRRAESFVNTTRTRRNVVASDGNTVDKNLTDVRKSPVEAVKKRRNEQFEDDGSDSSLEKSSNWNAKDKELESPRSNISIRKKPLRGSGSRIRWAGLSEKGTGVTRNAVASDDDTANNNNLSRVRKSSVETLQNRRSGQFEDASSHSSLERSATQERKDAELENCRSNSSVREKSFRADVSSVRGSESSKIGTGETGNAVASEVVTADKNFAGVQKSPVKRVQKRRSENFEDSRSNSGLGSSRSAEVSKKRSTPASAAEDLRSLDNLVVYDNAGEPRPTQVPKLSSRKPKEIKKGAFGNKLHSGSSDGKYNVSTGEVEQAPGTLQDAVTSINDLLPGTSAPTSNTSQQRIDSSAMSVTAEQDQEPCLRRSSRKRIPPIALWRNERCVTFKKDSGDVSIVYEKGTEEDCFAINHLEKKQKKKQKKMKSYNKTKEPRNVPKTRIVDERTQKIHHLSIHRPFNLYDWTIPTTADGRDPPYRITKGFSHDNISFGFVEITALGTKDPQYSPTDNLHFVVLNGVVDVTISNVCRTHTKFDSFIVPTGSSYSITNNCSFKALLSFCTFKTPFFAYQA